MSAANTPDVAPQGCAWVLAELKTSEGNLRPYYQTMPQHGMFADRGAAILCADRIRGNRVVHPILSQLVSIDDDEGSPA